MTRVLSILVPVLAAVVLLAVTAVPASAADGSKPPYRCFKVGKTVKCYTLPKDTVLAP